MGETVSSEISITEIMEAAKEKVHNDLVEAVVNDLKQSIGWRMKDKIETSVAEFFASEIAPELQKMLIEKKPEILFGIQTAVATMGKELSQKMINKLIEKISKLDDYQIREIFKNVF